MTPSLYKLAVFQINALLLVQSLYYWFSLSFSLAYLNRNLKALDPIYP